MVYPILETTSLAQRNEIANAPYIGVRLAGDKAVAHQWCTTPSMRAYAIKQLNSGDFTATHETALWIHTGIASLALERTLHFAQPTSSRIAGANRMFVPDQHTMSIAEQKLTTPERTAVDLLLADIETGITYLRELIAHCPSMTLSSTLDCAHTVRSKKDIGRVRCILEQLQLSE